MDLHRRSLSIFLFNLSSFRQTPPNYYFTNLTITIALTKTTFFRYYNKIGFIFAVSNDCYLTLRKERLWKSLKI